MSNLETLLEDGHWHYYVGIEIMLPKSMTEARAARLAHEKAMELSEDILGGYMADWRTGKSRCWWKRPTEHCRSHRFYENRKRAALMKKKLKGPTQ